LSGTKSETADSGGITTLADFVRTDRKEDRRPCRQEHCEGELSVTEDDIVLCERCRCDVDGVFRWPTSDDRGDDERDRAQYDNSGLVRLAGGYERVYDETHPAGDGRTYEYDLSTTY